MCSTVLTNTAKDSVVEKNAKQILITKLESNTNEIVTQCNKRTLTSEPKLFSDNINANLKDLKSEFISPNKNDNQFNIESFVKIKYTHMLKIY